MKNLKDKMYKGLAVATMAAMPAVALADDANLLETIKTEISGLKAGVLAIGAVVVGISIAFALVRIGKRGADSVG
ncbi:hypothetical protein [Neisseria musculi]|uniref:Uncharacterized protein n=1 Tax=Neisseria musculi TaxID=1815583 RepID=A0A7H1MBR9_9NEIS|nr:hypothetical protein [Neisseria musculi]QNT57968.1 hypothetical protein H7A79_2574 [Neisseria musculi]QNT58753.1 hypothetical protein H7A79_0178 [Neisseria musculi]QNT59084.1 hypothetical protein H7A79_0110 [Neisseria musculi]QNT59086.1 hypothetical protein H7A79_2456 [Neisseria musculi]